MQLEIVKKGQTVAAKGKLQWIMWLGY